MSIGLYDPWSEVVSTGPFVNVKDQPFNAQGDNVTDDTLAFVNAYATAAASKSKLVIPAGDYRITQTLIWDKNVSVSGEYLTTTHIHKVGNIVGIKIAHQFNGAGGDAVYEGFTVTSATGDTLNVGDVSDGVQVLQGPRITLEHIATTYHGGHGLVHKRGNLPVYRDIRSAANGGDGFRIEADAFMSSNSGTFSHIDVSSNLGSGLHLTGIELGTDFNLFLNVVAQGNFGPGVNFAGNSIKNVAYVYLESNVGADLTLGAATQNNFVTVINREADSLTDLGVNNWIFDPGFQNVLSVPGIGRIPQPNGVIGKDLSIAGGSTTGGAGAAQGGRLFLSGGDSAGTGNVPGAEVRINGGAPAGTSRYGPLMLQRGADGGVNIGGTTTPGAGDLLLLESTTQAFVINSMTEAQRDAISGIRDGMLVYNTTVSKLQIRAAGDWANLH